MVASRDRKSELERGLEQELDRCRSAGAEWERRAREWERRARTEHSRAEGLRQEIERVRTDNDRVVGKLTDKLIEMANRPPVVIQATDTIKELGEAVAKITGMSNLGPSAVVDGETGMDALGLTNDGGVVNQTKGRQWIPGIEFDPSLEDEARWPTHGGWWNPPIPPDPSSPTIPPTNGQPTHRQAYPSTGQPTTLTQGFVMTEDGPVRTDGQPMFRAGTGSEPPVGGVEQSGPTN